MPAGILQLRDQVALRCQLRLSQHPAVIHALDLSLQLLLAILQLLGLSAFLRQRIAQLEAVGPVLRIQCGELSLGVGHYLLQGLNARAFHLPTLQKCQSGRGLLEPVALP